MTVDAVVFAGVLLLIGVLFHFIPRLTRPDLFFAVTVAPEFRKTPEGRRIELTYRIIVWTITVAVIAAALLAQVEIIAALVEVGGATLALIVGHGQTLRYGVRSDPNVVVDLTAPVERLPGGPIAVLVPPLSVVALGAWLHFNWERVPDRLPVHWNLLGRPNIWIAATPAAVYRSLASHVFVCLLLAAGAWGILRWTRRISTTGPRAARERRFRKRMVQLSIVVEYFMAFLAWIPFFHPSSLLVAAWGLSLVVVLIGFTVILILEGQGGTRRSAVTERSPVGDRTPDAAWKLGIVYFNPSDRAILVEKRFGIGYTINFGNVWAWAVLLLLVIIWLVFLS